MVLFLLIYEWNSKKKTFTTIYLTQCSWDSLDMLVKVGASFFAFKCLKHVFLNTLTLVLKRLWNVRANSFNPVLCWRLNPWWKPLNLLRLMLRYSWEVIPSSSLRFTHNDFSPLMGSFFSAVIWLYAQFTHYSAVLDFIFFWSDDSHVMLTHHNTSVCLLVFSQFGFYDDNETVVEMQHQDVSGNPTADTHNSF